MKSIASILFLLALSIVLILVSSPTLADTFPQQIINTGHDWMVHAQAIPTVATDIGYLVTDGNPPIKTTIAVCQMDISVAPGASSVNITIADQQTSPQYFLQAVPITPTSATQGTTWIAIRSSSLLGCKVFTSGMTIQASASGASIYMTGRW